MSERVLVSQLQSRPDGPVQVSGWVGASNDHWIGRTIAGTGQVVQGVPILVVDGAVFEIRETNAERLSAAIAAGLAG